MQQVFSHTLKIPGNHSRQDLWLAMLALIQEPCCFIEALNRADVEEISSDTNQQVFGRKLDFGNFVLHDTVICEKDQSLSVCIPASATFAESKNVINIKELDDGMLGLVFDYFEDTDHPSVTEAKPYATLRYQAWKAKDLSFCRELLKRLSTK